MLGSRSPHAPAPAPAKEQKKKDFGRWSVQDCRKLGSVVIYLRRYDVLLGQNSSDHVKARSVHFYTLAAKKFDWRGSSIPQRERRSAPLTLNTP